MKRPLRILVKADNKPHIDIFEELLRALPEVVGDFEMRAIDCDLYYGHGIIHNWQRLGIATHEMPRPNGSRVPIWQDIGGSDVVSYFPTVMRSFERVLKDFQPDLFVLPYDGGPFEVGFIRRCARRRVPSMIIQEGLIIFDDGGDPVSFPNEKIRRDSNSRPLSARHFYRQSKKLLRAALGRQALPPVLPFGMNGADHIATIGPVSTRQLIERGVPSGRVTTTGLPRFDRLWRVATSKGRSPDSVLPRTSPKARVLFIQNIGFHFGAKPPAVFEDLDVMDEIAGQLDSRVHFAVRLRPEEIVSEYRSWWDHRFRFIQALPGTEDLYEHLLSCDVLIVRGFTTTQVEAMSLGLPIINYNPFRTDNYSFVFSGATLPAHDVATLASAIEQVLNGGTVLQSLAEGRERYLAERALIDGQASRRVAEFVVRIVEARQVRFSSIRQ